MIIKPNRQERTVLLIVICVAVGFALGAFSMSEQVKEKDKQINELIEVSEDLLNRVQFPNNTNHPNNFHKPSQ
tara:strand:+ start:1577 stop:1795 length:219 start_codon:yes stop_codon:yes gene_type:complete